MKYSPCFLSWFSRGHQSENTTSIPSRVIVLIRHGKYDFKTGLLTDLGNYGQLFSILVTFQVSCHKDFITVKLEFQAIFFCWVNHLFKYFFSREATS